MTGDTTTIFDNEQMFIERGISINIAQTYDIGRIKVGTYFDDVEPSGVGPEDYHDYFEVVAPNNGVITSSIEFEKPDEKWLSGIRDIDVAASYLNWIRSGTYVDMDEGANNDYSMSSDAYNSKGESQPWDPTENFEKIAERTWAPALLTTASGQGSDNMNPGPLFNAGSRYQEGFKRTASVDIVLTADKSKWTRCPVLEMSMDKNLAEGGVNRFFLRKHASVDKDGKPYIPQGSTTAFNDWANAADPANVSHNEEDANFISAQGMGWFPGYVIDVER